jgi:hypothetical protein
MSQKNATVMLGAFHTGILIELAVIRLFEWLGADPISTRMALKAVWWLLGTGIIAVIGVTLVRIADVPKRFMALSLAIAFGILFCLPVTQLALKTVNYDLISYGFGTLALLLLVRAAAAARSELAWAALALATLAAQEKSAAAPVLLGAIGVLILMVYSPKRLIERLMGSLSAAALALTMVLAIAAASMAAYRLLGPQIVPPGFWSWTVDPLVTWTWIPLALMFPIQTLVSSRIAEAAGVFSTIAAFAIVAALLRPRPDIIGQWTWRRFQAHALTACAMLTAVVFVTGVTAAETITPYWAPFHPTPLSALAARQTINGVILHTGAASMAAHLGGIIAYALAVMVVSIPSVVWIVAVIGWAVCMHADARGNSNCGPVPLCLVLAALVVPIAAAVTAVPFAHRYFNLSIAWLVLAMLLWGLAVLRTQWAAVHPGKVSLAAAGLVAALLLEAAPFRPLFAAFRPFWLNYAESERPEPGRLNASWMGWGEEVMQAGKILDRRCIEGDLGLPDIPCKDITLHVMIPGLWLPGPRTIQTRYSFIDASGPLPLDRQDYFVVNRNYFVQKVFSFPAATPVFMLTSRGYGMAWVYRGDDLRKINYQFNR